MDFLARWSTIKPKVVEGSSTRGFRLSCDLLLGSGFDTFRNEITGADVICAGEERLGKVGWFLPEHVNGFSENQSSNAWRLYKSEEALAKQRFRDWHGQTGVNRAGIRGVGDWEDTIKSKESGATRILVLEKRIMKLQLKREAPISPEFKSAVERLPQSCDPSDIHNEQRWRSFFSTWGTHYVSRAFVGGSIVVITSSANALAFERLSSQNEGDIKLQEVMDLLPIGYNKSEMSSSDSSISASYGDTQILVTGGDNARALKLLGSMQNHDPSLLADLSSWEESVKESPVVIQSSMALSEVAEVADRWDSDAANAIRDNIIAIKENENHLGTEVRPSLVSRQLRRLGAQVDVSGYETTAAIFLGLSTFLAFLIHENKKRKDSQNLFF